MKHEIEGSDLRACIDKSFDAGFDNAINKSYEWLCKFLQPFMGVSLQDQKILLRKYKQDMKLWKKEI